jgi:hypothetical protein
MGNFSKERKEVITCPQEPFYQVTRFRCPLCTKFFLATLTRSRGGELGGLENYR